jgi:hypothetical protein
MVVMEQRHQPGARVHSGAPALNLSSRTILFMYCLARLRFRCALLFAASFDVPSLPLPVHKECIMSWTRLS